MATETTSPAAWLLRLAGVMLLALALGSAAFRAPARSLESLVQRWAPPPSDFVELGAQLMHYRDEGPRSDPLPLLMLHGSASSLHSWDAWAAALSAQGRRVVRLDLPGFGLSGPAAGGDYGDAAYLDFLTAALQHLGLKRVVLVGQGLGAQLSWQLALRQPEQVAGLVLLNAGAREFLPESAPLLFTLARLPGAGWLAEGLLPRRLVEQALQQAYGQPARLRAATVERYFELSLREGNRSALVDFLDQRRTPLDLAPLNALRVPTLVLWGARDRLLPIEDGQTLAQAIPGSRLIPLSQLGHLPQEEDGPASLAAVADFLHTLKP
ncbi:MAG: alpha/beta fold hydrolase [Roseateles sp.]